MLKMVTKHEKYAVSFQSVNYLARAVTSPEPDLGKAVVSGFVRSLSDVCPGMYVESTGRILVKFCTKSKQLYSVCTVRGSAMLHIAKIVVARISLNQLQYYSVCELDNCRLISLFIIICRGCGNRVLASQTPSYQSSRDPADLWANQTWPVKWIFYGQSGCKWSLQHCLGGSTAVLRCEGGPFARTLSTQNPLYSQSPISCKISHFSKICYLTIYIGMGSMNAPF